MRGLPVLPRGKEVNSDCRQRTTFYAAGHVGARKTCEGMQIREVMDAAKVKWATIDAP